MKKNNNFVVYKTTGGVYIKRYYTYEKNAQGVVYRKFYYAKRMNFAEKVAYKVKEITKGIVKKPTNIVKVGGITLLIGGVIFTSACGNGKEAPNTGYVPDNVTIVEGTLDMPEVIDLDCPEAITYVGSNGNTYLTLDSALEISRYNYLNLEQELQNYNDSCQKGKEYNFDVSKFDLNTFVGLQLRESSLQLNNGNDGHYKGGFKIGDAAAKEANEVAINLTGKAIFESEADREDPIKASKACMYITVKNYEYIYDHIQKLNQEKGLNLQVTPEMVIDTYLMGCGNTISELSAITNTNEYSQKYYSKDINVYADILYPYSTALFEQGLIEEEHDEERKAVYTQLNSVVSSKNATGTEAQK